MVSETMINLGVYIGAPREVFVASALLTSRGLSLRCVHPEGLRVTQARGVMVNAAV